MVVLLLAASTALVASAAAVFFGGRHLFSRSLAAIVISALGAGLVVRMTARLWFAVAATDRRGLQLATISSSILLPLIVTQLVRPLFMRAVRRVEDLLITAQDTDNWSDAWRAAFVAEHRDLILTNSTAIQREWVRLRKRPLGPLPWFAALFLGESHTTIARYLRADRSEPPRQLAVARGARLPSEEQL